MNSINSASYKNIRVSPVQVLSKFLFILFLFFSGQANAQAENENAALLEKLLLLKNDTAKVDSLVIFERRMVNIDDLKLSVSSGTAAVALADKLNYKAGLLPAYSLLGNIYRSHGEYDQSLNYHNKALKVAEGLNSKSKVAKCYVNIGITERYKGNYLDATKQFIQAQKLYSEAKDTAGLALIYQSMGVVSKLQQKNEEALSYYELAEKYYKVVKSKGGVDDIWHNKGIVYKELGMLDSAYSNLTAVYESRKSEKNNNWYNTTQVLANTITRMGSKEMERKEYSKATNYFSQAEKLLFECLKWNEMNGNELNKSKDLTNLGVLYLNQLHYVDAKKYFVDAYEILIKHDAKVEIPAYYSNFSYIDSVLAADSMLRMEERLYHAQQSQYYKSKEAASFFEIINEKNNKEIAALKIQYEAEKKDNEIVLLNKENELKDISLKEQLSALLISKLRDEKNKKEIELLNSSGAITELQLSGTRQKLEQQLLKSKAAAYELQLAKQERDLKNNELSEERLLRGVTTGGAFALLIIGLLVFNRFKLRKQLEQKEAILGQRKAISADLHDDVGSTLSSISIYSEAIKNKLAQNDTDKVMDLVNTIGESARETISNLSDIVWSINPINDRGEVIFSRMESLAFSLFSSKGIKLNFSSDKSLNAINYSIEMKQNMFLIFKEAINNCAKYAQASEVKVEIKKTGQLMNIIISDNGKGFDTTTSSLGNGLRNMRERARDLQGTLAIQSSEKGTTINLSMPLPS